MREKEFYFKALNRAIKEEKNNKENIEVLEYLKNILENAGLEDWI